MAYLRQARSLLGERTVSALFASLERHAQATNVLSTLQASAPAALPNLAWQGVRWKRTSSGDFGYAGGRVSPSRQAGRQSPPDRRPVAPEQQRRQPPSSSRRLPASDQRQRQPPLSGRHPDAFEQQRRRRQPSSSDRRPGAVEQQQRRQPRQQQQAMTALEQQQQQQQQQQSGVPAVVRLELDDDGEEAVLAWPLPDHILAAVNPELREVVLADQARRRREGSTASASGELRERLRERLRNRWPGRDDLQLVEGSSSGGDALVLRVLLMKLKVDELKRELAECGQRTSGRKAELADRLIAALGMRLPVAEEEEDGEEEEDTMQRRAEQQRLRQRQRTSQQGVGDLPAEGRVQGDGDGGGAALELQAEEEQGAASGGGAGGSDLLEQQEQQQQQQMTPRQRRHGRVFLAKPPRLPPQVWDGVSDPAADLQSQRVEFSRVFTPQEVVSLLHEARAEDVVVVDVRGRCTWAEYFVVATGQSLRHVQALGQAVLYQVKERTKEVAPGVKAGLDGGPGSEWVAVDAGSVVAHLLTEQAREELDLEGLWASGEPSRVTRFEPQQGAPQTLRTMRVER